MFAATYTQASPPYYSLSRFQWGTWGTLPGSQASSLPAPEEDGDFPSREKERMTPAHSGLNGLLELRSRPWGLPTPFCPERLRSTRRRSIPNLCRRKDLQHFPWHWGPVAIDRPPQKDIHAGRASRSDRPSTGHFRGRPTGSSQVSTR